MKIFGKLKKILNKKFSKDVFLNGLSILCISLNVLLVNTIISKYYGVDKLGIYHISLSIYIVASVFIVFGIPNSLLKYSSEIKDERAKLSNLVSSGILLIVFFSALMVVVIYYVLAFNFLKLPIDVLPPLKIMLVSLPLFSINKGYRGFYNGIRYMKTYALVEFCRWLIISIFIVCCIIFQKDFITIFYSFLLAESLILLFLFIYSGKQIDFTFRNKKETYIRHLSFGIKTILGGSLLIVNNKIDVLLISFLTSNNYAVGVYAFAAEIAKGVLYFSNIVQINFNPIISRLCADNNILQLKDYVKKIGRAMVIILLPLLLIIAVIYPLYVSLMFENQKYVDSIPIFYILLSGVGFGALFFWGGTILSMAGFPQDSIKRNSMLIVCNIVLNIALIPLFGITGAAFATSFTYLFRVLTLEYYLKKRLGINLISSILGH